jgi:cytochrome c oxidase subunit 2
MGALSKFIYPMPPLYSVEGGDVDLLMLLVHLLMLALFLGWAIFFIVALFKFNRKNNPKVSQKKINSSIPTTIELIVAAIEMLLLIAISIPFWTNRMAIMPDGRDINKIRIVAQQFAWNIHYPGPDGRFGTTKQELLSENAIGLDTKSPNAADDVITMNQLHVPVGKTTVISLSSKDVVHSFWIPEMRSKQDAIPGMTTMVRFTPTKAGNFEIVCAQLCGVGHYQMRGFVTVQSENEYNEWLKSANE